MVDLVGRLQNRYTQERCINRCDATEITVAVDCHRLFTMQTATIQKVGCIKPYVMDKADSKVIKMNIKCAIIDT